MTTLPACSTFPVHNHAGDSIWGRVSWGAIMVGAVSAIGLQFIFTILGLAIGATVGDAAAGADASDTAATVSIAAGVWWLVTGIISLMVGGIIFGRLSGLPRSLPLNLEAVGMWGVVALFGFMVLWSGAGMLTQAASPLGAIAMSNAAQPYSPMAPASLLENAADPARTAAAPGTAGNPSAAATDRPTSATVAAAAEDAREATQAASWWSVVGLVAGVAAAVGGACLGVPREFHPRGRVVVRTPAPAPV